MMAGNRPGRQRQDRRLPLQGSGRDGRQGPQGNHHGPRDSRKLIRVTIDEDEPGETGDLVERLMGKKPELRFQYIQENARFVEELDV